MSESGDKKSLPLDEVENYRLWFGWLKFRPKKLQGLLSPKWALFWLCWAGAVQGM